MNGIWIITFVSHLHVWITKFKPSFMFYQVLVLTPNKVIWVNFSGLRTCLLRDHQSLY